AGSLGVDTGARLALFREQLAAMPVTGRKPLPAKNVRWLQLNPRHDVLFNGGDRLLRPLYAPDSVQVLGDVPAPCQLPVAPDLRVREAVAACLSDRRLLPDEVYLIAPDMQVIRVETALWNRGDNPGLMPGARILVPFRGLAARSGNPAADTDLAAWLATQPVIPEVAPAAAEVQP
ncbi:MAG: capsule biosynthesis GfcC family protein, partial [Perlucidibaca sp.]